MRNRVGSSWVIALGAFWLAVFFGWLTHMWWSLSGLFTGSMTEMSQFVVAVLGAFLPPIGVVHGWYIWFT